MSDDNAEEESVLNFSKKKSPSEDSAYNSSHQDCDITSHTLGEVGCCEPKSTTNASNLQLESSHHNSTNDGDNYPDIPHELLKPEVVLSSDSGTQRNFSGIFNCKHPHCGFKTSSSTVLMKHQSSHDPTQNGRYQCDICHMKFTVFANMRRHKLGHYGVRPFECRLCTKRFFRKDHLMEHLVRQHSKQRPYHCPFCIKSFNFRQHLKSHLSSDHAVVAHDKTCRLCGFRASSVTGAKIHFTTCHLKQNTPVQRSDPVASSSSLIATSQSCFGGTETTIGVDLGTVSQNFAFVPPHYPPVSITGDGIPCLEGPSSSHFCFPLISQDVTAPSQVSVISCRGQPSHNLISGAISSPVCSNSSPTTTMSPSVGRNTQLSHNGNISFGTNSYVTRMNVKTEPPEVLVEDSENSTSQPTSTMELTTNQVETSYSHEHPGQEPSEANTSLETKHSPCSEHDSDSWLSGNITHRTSLDCHHAQHDLVTSNITGLSSTHTNINWSTESENKSCKDKTTKVCRHGRFHCKKYCTSVHQMISGKCGKSASSNNQTAINEDSKQRNGRKRHYSETVVSENRSVPFRETSVLSTREASVTDTNVPTTPPATCYHLESKVQPENIFDDNHDQDKSALHQNSLSCPYCGIVFPDHTLYFLHRSLHTDASPWKCNLCGQQCRDKYDFNSHIISQTHR